MKDAPAKRVLDVVVSASALCVLWPVILVVALLVRSKLGAPVLFRQIRPGLDGRPFEILKFRSMAMAPAREETPDFDHERLSNFGRRLRASSLDELPSLWNVLRGDMSLVGPRPLLMKYLPLYSTEQSRRHAVRPGLTGWAQVKGRNAISWARKLELDVWYVDHRSLWLDARIMLMTIEKVFDRQGVSAEGRATTTEFRGTES